MMENTHERAGGTNRQHGDEYHLRLAILLMLQAYDEKLKFKIALEYKKAGRFDDIFLKIQGREGVWTEYYFQVKHAFEPDNKSDKTLKKIKFSDLFPELLDKKTSGKKDLKLSEFLNSYRNFETSDNSERRLIIFTNKCLEEEECFENYNLKLLKSDIFEREHVLFQNLFAAPFLKIKLKSPYFSKLLDVLRRKTNESDVFLNADFESFLSQLYLAEDQLTTEELRDKIVSIISKYSNNSKADAENIYANIRSNINEWFGAEVGTFKSRKDVQLLLQDASNIFFFKIRKPNSSFVNRTEELKKIESSILTAQSNSPRTVVVCGKAGVGKTELVLTHTSNHMCKYSHIIWINAESHSTLQQSFVNLSQKLGLMTESENLEFRDLVSRVYKYFEKDDKLCCIIFDNAQQHTNDNKSEGIEEFLPGVASKANCHIIITTQNSSWKYELISLLPFDDNDSLALLKTSLKGDNSTTDKLQLANAFDHLPLALNFASSYINHECELCQTTGEDYNIANFLEEYNVSTNKVENHKYAINAIWNMAKNRFQKDEKDLILPLKIVQIMSYCEPDGIPTTLFLYLKEETKRTVQKALKFLSDFSLIRIECGLAFIHRLLQLTIREDLKQNNKEEDVLHSALKLFYLNFTNNNRKSHEFFKVYIEHAINIWNYSLCYPKMAMKYAMIIEYIFRYLIEDFQLDKVIMISENTLNKVISRESLDNSDVAVLKIKIHVANCNKIQGEFGKALLKIDDILKELESIEIQFTASATNNLHDRERARYIKSAMADGLHVRASVSKNKGEYELALEQCNKSIDYRNKEDTQDRMHTEFEYASILRLMGHLNRSLRFLKYIHSRQLKYFKDSSHQNILLTLEQMAITLNSLGKYSDSLKICNDILCLKRKQFNENHPYILSTKHSRGGVLDYLGEYTEALETFQEVYSDSSDKLGPDHPVTISALNKKALVLLRTGKYKDAEKFSTLVIAKRMEKLGPTHQDTLTSKCDNAMILFCMEKYEKALEALDEILDVMMEQGRKPDDYYILYVKDSKAATLYHLGKKEEALKLFKDVLDSRKIILNDIKEQHPRTLRSLHNFASVKMQMNQYDKALPILEETYEKKKKIIGEEHPETLFTKHNIAYILYKQGKINKAREMLQSVYDCRLKKLGEDHKYTAETFHLLTSIESNKLNEEIKYIFSV